MRPAIPLQHGFGLGGYIPRAIDPGASLPPQWPAGSDRERMGLALLKAMDTVGLPSPNPGVGALLCKDGRIIGSGATEIYGGRHAERVALNQAAGVETLGADCFVTLEPCALPGKQPPCTDALIQAGVSRCVIASHDPHPKASGVGLERLKKAGVKVETGCLAPECMAWHFPFLAYQDLGRPVLIGKWAQTLDGHLADDFNESQWISGPSSRVYTHWLRQKYDAILVGAGTVLKDAPKLTVRSVAALRQPHKIVFDPSGRLLQAKANVIAALSEELSAQGPYLYWCTSMPVDLSRSQFRELQDRLILVPLEANGSMAALIDAIQLQHRARFPHDMQSILVEGGSQLLTLLMRADLLDALHVFVRAGILGGQENRLGRLREDNPSLPLMQRHDFKLLSSFQLDDDIVMECVNRRFSFWNESNA